MNKRKRPIFSTTKLRSRNKRFQGQKRFHHSRDELDAAFQEIRNLSRDKEILQEFLSTKKKEKAAAEAATEVVTTAIVHQVGFFMTKKTLLDELMNVIGKFYELNPLYTLILCCFLVSG